jgi:hypothetical protein
VVIDDKYGRESVRISLIEAIVVIQGLIGDDGNRVSSSYMRSAEVKIVMDVDGDEEIVFDQLNLWPVKEDEATRKHLLALARREE